MSNVKSSQTCLFLRKYKHGLPLRIPALWCLQELPSNQMPSKHRAPQKWETTSDSTALQYLELWWVSTPLFLPNPQSYQQITQAPGPYETWAMNMKLSFQAGPNCSVTQPPRVWKERSSQTCLACLLLCAAWLTAGPGTSQLLIMAFLGIRGWLRRWEHSMSEHKHQGLGPQDPIKSQPGWTCLLPQYGGEQEKHRGLLTASPEPSLARNPVEKDSVEKVRNRALGHLLAFPHTCAYTHVHSHSHTNMYSKEKRETFFIIVLIFIQFPLSGGGQNFKKWWN